MKRLDSYYCHGCKIDFPFCPTFQLRADHFGDGIMPEGKYYNCALCWESAIRQALKEELSYVNKVSWIAKLGEKQKAIETVMTATGQGELCPTCPRYAQCLTAGLRS